MKGASDQMSQMSVPTVLVELKVRYVDINRHIHTQTAHSTPDSIALTASQLAGGAAPAANTVQFELSNETLRAVLEGLGKIRDQLNAVNQQP